MLIIPPDLSDFNSNAILPYGLTINHVCSAMNDFCGFLNLIDTELFNKGMPILESMLMPANFSSIVGEYINATIPKYCTTLVKNRYHNGHPDMIEKGKFLNDMVQHSHEGIEIKASRYVKGWQGHNPENVWLMVFVFESTRPKDDIVTPFSFLAVYAAKVLEEDWQYAGRNEGSRRTITATIKSSGFEKMSKNWIYKSSSLNSISI